MPPEFRTLPPVGPSWFRTVQPIHSTIRLVMDLPEGTRLARSLAGGGLHPGLQIIRPDDVDATLASGQFDVLLTTRQDRILACKEQAPRAVRVWFIPEPGIASSAWRCAHHYLTPSAGLTDLCSVLDGALGGNGVADLRLPREPNGEVTKLPGVAADLMTLLDDPDASNAQLKKSLEKDPLLVARVLQSANSPYFGLPRRVGSLNHALALLGRNNVRSAVLVGACFHAIDGVDPEHVKAVSQRGLKTMRLVRQMAGAHAESAITAAVLADIGMLLMMKSDPDYPQLIERSLSEKTPLHLLEEERYGFNHAHLGARLLHEWNLPAPTIEAVAYSHTPYPRVRRNHSPRMMLFVAAHLIDAHERGVAVDLDPAWVQEMKLERDLREWESAVADAEMLAFAG